MTIAERPTIPAARYAERLERARVLAGGRGLDGLLVGLGPDMRYLVGYDALPLERLTLLVVPADGRPTLVAPRLEAIPARSCPAAAAGIVDVVTWDETDDPLRLVARAVGFAPVVLAVSDRLWAIFLLRLQETFRRTRFVSAGSVLRELRSVKDADEIALLGLAAAAADRVVERIAAGRLVGRTEAELAREIRELLVEEGHDQPEFAIVASGPNSASPHHEPSGRPIRAGEPVVLDIGGTLAGYASDITRTLWVSGRPSVGPDETFVEVYETVRRAQAEATAAVRPGVPAERIDATARGVIERAGYGDRFIHRTGHGIGLEVHEDPYLVGGNGEPLRAGEAFSVEPGIYLEGRFGVRIEDIVVCAEDGPRVLNSAPRELRVVEG